MFEDHRYNARSNSDQKERVEELRRTGSATIGSPSLVSGLTMFLATSLVPPLVIDRILSMRGRFSRPQEQCCDSASGNHYRKDKRGCSVRT
jgi:hypothetical protein